MITNAQIAELGKPYSVNIQPWGYDDKVTLFDVAMDRHVDVRIDMNTATLLTPDEFNQRIIQPMKQALERKPVTT